MKSYDEYCAIAKALDMVGDRWTLLIVRELSLRGPSRYTDLRNGLPGIATNLLAERLRELERAGAVAREEAPPPIATTLFWLTPRGAELKPVLDGLFTWGMPLMAEQKPQDAVRSHWLAGALETCSSTAIHVPRRSRSNSRPGISRSRSKPETASSTPASAPPKVLI